jgi:hypothetical protein
MARSCWARRPGPVEEVFDLSFREAAERRAGLVAVRTWSDPLIDIGSLRPEELRHWDRTEDRAQRELELAPWIVIHPEVSVEIMVVQDRATDFLLALSHRAQLLVLGRSTRGALLGLIAGGRPAARGELPGDRGARRRPAAHQLVARRRARTDPVPG